MRFLDSYTQGHDAEMKDPYMQEEFPVWQYLIVDDTRTGDDHRPKGHRYYPATAAFADVRGNRVFNCRCCPNPVHRLQWKRLQEQGAQLEREW